MSALLASVIAVLIQPASQATLLGNVVSDHGRPIAGAEVLIEALKLSAKANQAGEFELTAPAGLRTFLFRAIGYEPAFLTLTLSDSRPTEVTIELRRRVQVLDSLTTVVDAPRSVSAKMAGFEDRRKAGIGEFIDRDQLLKRENSLLSDVLRATGIPLMRRPARCGGGYSAGTNRGIGSFRAASILCGFLPMPVGCYMAVYLDGMRIWAPPQIDPQNIDAFSPHELEAVEVYRGAGQAPPQYTLTGNDCGVVLLWTRER